MDVSRDISNVINVPWIVQERSDVMHRNKTHNE
jgi:hypothetical protein